jgi:hypothetical protein
MVIIFLIVAATKKTCTSVLAHFFTLSGILSAVEKIAAAAQVLSYGCPNQEI